MSTTPPISRMRSRFAAMNRSSCSPARTRKSDRSRAASRAISARRAFRRGSIVTASLGSVLEIGSHPLPEEHRMMTFEDPFGTAMGDRLDALVPLELVERGVVGQVEQDHVVVV